MTHSWEPFSRLDSSVDASIDNDRRWMATALGLATQGAGWVEPNPQVGCVIVRDGAVVAEGWHARFGGPHAEVMALQQAGAAARGATLYTTLEPCCHHGKTPPCTAAIVQAGIGRVVVALADPYPEVQGGGIAALTAAGIECDIGVHSEAARRLLAPYLKLVTTGRPWVIAKWAMTLDGKLATRGGDSRWISNESSREVVHQLRGRMDAIVVGSATALADDPLLTARPRDPAHLRRLASRVVVDSRCTLPLESKLVKSAAQVPLVVAASADAVMDDLRLLAAAGAEVLAVPGNTHAARIGALLDELGRRRMTNVLVEGGSRLLGLLFDERCIDEIHVFVAPVLAGGAEAPSPLGGAGVESIAAAHTLRDVVVESLQGDLYLRGRIVPDA